ncbi:MAG TPA: serine--tRNA ligase, partial [candidate division WOR-3 bacterium]|nr:serine--tRNA ligase [candidate division WOR-3 bacterium]
MIDIKLIRENPDLIKGDLIKRGELKKLRWIDEILELDKKWRENLREINNLRRERNKLAIEIGKRKKSGEAIDELIKKSDNIVKRIEEIEKENNIIRGKIDYYLWRLPNITHESVPIGKDDTENVPIRFWGRARVWEGHLETFLKQSQGKMEYEIITWKPELHADLLPKIGGADLERAAKVSGARFFYLLNELVILDLALI